MKSFSAYCKEIFIKRFLEILAAITGLYMIIDIVFNLHSGNRVAQVVTGISLVIIVLLIRIFQVGYRYFNERMAGVPIKRIYIDEDYYLGEYMVQLEERSWLLQDQRLEIIAYSSGAPTPVGLMKIVSRVEDYYGIGIITDIYHPDRFGADVLLDKYRWESMKANPSVIAREG
jgi:hypothetical protein